MRTPVCDDCEWSLWLERIEEGLDTGRLEHKREFLEGVYDTIEANEHATERQIEVIEDIVSSVE